MMVRTSIVDLYARALVIPAYLLSDVEYEFRTLAGEDRPRCIGVRYHSTTVSDAVRDVAKEKQRPASNMWKASFRSQEQMLVERVIPLECSIESGIDTPDEIAGTTSELAGKEGIWTAPRLSGTVSSGREAVH